MQTKKTRLIEYAKSQTKNANSIQLRVSISHLFVDIRDEIKKMELIEIDKFYKGNEKTNYKNAAIYNISKSPVQIKLVYFKVLQYLEWQRRWISGSQNLR